MPKEKISQEVLKRILQTQAQISELEAQLETDEAEVIAALKAEATIASGVFTATIETTNGRRSPKWKEVVEREIDSIRGDGEGAKFTARVIASTKPSEGSEKLVVKVAA